MYFLITILISRKFFIINKKLKGHINRSYIKMPHPLEGVRVLSVEQYGAGPFGSMWLADQGAEVIKIEQPGVGDFARDLGPYWFDNGESQWFHA